MYYFAKKYHDAINTYRSTLYTTFGVQLGKFYRPIYGFDIIAFDEWLGVPDGVSTADYVAKEYGADAVVLVKALLKR